MATRRRLVVVTIVAGGVLLAATAAVVDRLNPTLASLPPVMHEPRVPAAAGPPPSTAPVTSAAVPSPTRSPTPGRSRRPPATPVPTTTAPPVDAPVVLLSFEAEDPNNDLDGSADRVRFEGASGGRVVGYLGRVWGTPGTLRFPEVGVPAAGRYQMTVHYTASDDRVAVITVNGVAMPGVAFRRSSGITTMIVSISLRTGTNTIEFGNPTARCPAIDRIVLGV